MGAILKDCAQRNHFKVLVYTIVYTMIKRYDVFDEIVKEVVPFGNGSIVYTPKKWVGQTVRVILEGEPVNIKESTMEYLNPFLEHIKGVFLFGSFARKEQTKDSDIDVLVIADKKFKLEKKGRFDFTVLDEETLKKELGGKDPFYVYFILQEAKAILNEELLRELKESKIDKFNFKWMVEESESALKISREFLNWDKREKRKKLDSTAIIYSMVLRLRRIFLVQCLLENKKYSNKEFKESLTKKGLSSAAVEDSYRIYQEERDEKKTKKAISIEDAEKLYEITKNEIKKMKEAYKWHQKRKH